MWVRELMTEEPALCVPTDSCVAAGAIMRVRRCGFVPVVEHQATKRLVGVVTDRDLAMYLTHTDQPASQVRVEACMSRCPRTIGPDEELTAAAAVMEAAAVHRLPVVENGRVVGVLSIDDIAKAARKEWAGVGPHLAERQLSDIVEAIATAYARSA